MVPVAGRRALSRFIRLPWSLYGDDPMWVPPLLMERRQHLSASNPYFDHAVWQAWLAYRGKRAVGRISAQVDRLYQEYHGEATGFFGFLEAVDDPEVFRALLGSAEDWLRAQGMKRVLGPFSFSINDESGLLVEGFETPPMIMMGHARPYYGARVEQQGYTGVKDLLAYHWQTDFPVPPALAAMAARAGSKVRLRALRRERLAEELKMLRDIFNDAWAQNWGFVPFTEAEFARVGRDMMRLIGPEFVQIAEVDGEPAAMIVLLPNLNEIIRDLNGRLLPFGWVKLLWRLQRAYPKTARVPLMGVRKRYQQTLLGGVLAFQVMDALRAPGLARGIREVELSWILEDNRKMRRIVESAGGIPYKRYRIYGKDL